MARGGESKSIEAQIESAQTSRSMRKKRRERSDPIELVRQKENLLLSRVRVKNQLEATQNPRYQQMLSKALADLDARLSQYDQVSSPRTRSS